MKDKIRIKHLEKVINKQKTKIFQFENIIKELKFLIKSKKDEAFIDLTEIQNNLDDDLTMDKKYGEFGYKDEKEVVQAIKKYTKKVINRKLTKWQRFCRKKE